MAVFEKDSIFIIDVIHLYMQRSQSHIDSASSKPGSDAAKSLSSQKPEKKTKMVDVGICFFLRFEKYVVIKMCSFNE